VEIVPSNFTDVVREPIKNVTERSRAINDALSYKLLNDAIVDAESVGARLHRKVISEDLFFTFGQTFQSIG